MPSSNRTQLGTLFAPEARPFAGAKIRILTQDEGPRGAISGPLTAFAPVFEELSLARSATAADMRRPTMARKAS